MATLDEVAWDLRRANALILENNRQIAQLRREADLWKNCAQLLRGEFTPNTNDHPAIQEYNKCCEVYDPTNDYYEPCA